jgi:hypothetical protein
MLVNEKALASCRAIVPIGEKLLCYKRSGHLKYVAFVMFSIQPIMISLKLPPFLHELNVCH